MGSVRFLGSGLIFLLAFLTVYSQPYDDLSDLRGLPYCEFRGCCDGREDTCSVPILGTLCYCDDFCNETRVEDCCPDFWTHCKGIRPPTPPPTVEPIISCLHKDRALFLKQKVKENCNECECTLMGRKPEVLCETNTCLVDPDLIEAINRETMQYGWTATNHSEFWGRTLDDGILHRLGTLQPQRFVLKMTPVRRNYDPNALPREFDAETKWAHLTGIQDQGWCGSSWAISTAAVASDRYAIVSKGLEHVQLSAQNLISCDTLGQQNCSGGHLDRAWSFVRKHGLVDEDCFPYAGKNEKCTIKRRGNLLDSGCNPPVYGNRKGRYTTGPAYRLSNETDIMYEITRSGPVQATMVVYHDFFQYKGGIYRQTDLVKPENKGYHSVRIVGWGEEDTYDGIKKYWKVANSWGPNWGENGHFRIAKGTNECEIESFVLAVWPHVDRKLLLTSANEVLSF